MTPERVVTIGVAGQDFHPFNTYFRNYPNDHVIAFTAVQIPGIANRVYPPIPSNSQYPEGILQNSSVASVYSSLKMVRH